MQKITKCIIPAAGFGTRFLPATKALPKEMLPVVDKPVIQYLVEEAISAGITDIIIVSHRAKKSMEDHFDEAFELEKILESKWKLKELEEVQKIAKMANFYFVRQWSPRWDGDALLRAEKIIGNEPCLVLFGDDLIRWEKSGAMQLVQAFENTQTPVIALEKVPENKVKSYGIVETKTENAGIYEVEKFLEKPLPTETSSRLGVIGKYIITPEIFEYLKNSQWAASKDGENRLADAFAAMLADGKKITATEIQWKRYDTGDKLGFLKATVDYALERKELSEEFFAFLEETVKNHHKK